jgi:5-enolpyruvylshikimate-3-phosphate synthase
MTIAMLVEHGVRVRTVEETEISGHSRRTWHVDPCDLRAFDRVVEPDASNALPFIAAALATGGRIRIRHWPRKSIQPTEQILEVVRAFGGVVSVDDDGLLVDGPTQLRGVQADLREIGETAPTFAALAALASEPSSLHGIAHLRGHETDRLAALHAEISALGGDIEQTDDALLLRPAALSGNSFRTYEDHRMATCAAILGLRVPGIEVENVATTAKTLPNFPQRWNALLPA